MIVSLLLAFVSLADARTTGRFARCVADLDGTDQAATRDDWAHVSQIVDRGYLKSIDWWLKSPRETRFEETARARRQVFARVEDVRRTMITGRGLIVNGAIRGEEAIRHHLERTKARAAEFADGARQAAAAPPFLRGRFALDLAWGSLYALSAGYLALDAAQYALDGKYLPATAAALASLAASSKLRVRLINIYDNVARVAWARDAGPIELATAEVQTADEILKALDRKNKTAFIYHGFTVETPLGRLERFGRGKKPLTADDLRRALERDAPWPRDRVELGIDHAFFYDRDGVPTLLRAGRELF